MGVFGRGSGSGQQKTPEGSPGCWELGKENPPGGGLFSRRVAPRVSLVLGSFTAVFGKGTGGTAPRWSPGGILPYLVVQGTGLWAGTLTTGWDESASVGFRGLLWGSVGERVNSVKPSAISTA